MRRAAFLATVIAMGTFAGSARAGDIELEARAYVGARLGLDIPVAGPMVAFVIGFRTPGESESITARTAPSLGR
jgi:hypothetical protein